MASGLPVVGLEAEGVCDLVRHEQSGLLLNTEVCAGEEQVEAYRTCLTRLVDNRRERARFSQFALDGSFTATLGMRRWNALVDGYSKVIEKRTQV